jgi:hypothetical protein
MHRILGLAGVLLLVAAPLVAQARQEAALGRILARVVDDETGQPIQGATVRLLASDLPAQLSNAEGRFAFVGVPGGVYHIEIGHVAYGSGKQQITVEPGSVVEFEARLRPNAIALDSLVINVKARPARLEEVGFLRRQRTGWGHHFTSGLDDPWRIRQVLYNVPWLQFAGSSGRIAVMGTGRRRCIPEIYVDGFRQGWADGDIEMVVAGLDVEGIEVYRGMETPLEFASAAGMRSCGAIVIWTRRRRRAGRSPTRP